MPSLPRPKQLLSHTVFAVLVSLSVHAASKNKPTSKLFVTDVSGAASIDTGEKLEDLAKRSVYTAEGTVIETKRAGAGVDQAKAYSTMVYSNGTGAYFDADTRVEVKEFVQEPFTPNRNDSETEPSISQTQAFVARGAVGLCNSKLVAGSSMVYNTPHGSVSIRGKKVVIEASGNTTKISMLEGESTVRAGSMDLGGHTVRAGEQAIIHSAGAGQPNRIEIQRIPPPEMSKLDDKVAMACMAKKTVYFEERERKIASNGAKSADGSGSASNTDGDGNAGAEANGRVTAFDGKSGSSSSTSATTGTVREIVPVEIVPTNLPTEFTISPATIVSGGRPGG
jgi:hypothetical protein